MRKPHDISDLYLAPIVLELDDRLERFARMGPEQLKFAIMLETNRVEGDEKSRLEMTLEAISRNLEMHAWEVSWDPRGLRVAHERHGVVLGLPRNVRAYLRE